MPKVPGKAKTALGSKLKDAGAKVEQPRKDPLWDGPEADTVNGGVTQTLLSRFLGCRERFRLMAIEGLRPIEVFEPRIEYGNMWHVCEEEFARSGNPIMGNPLANPPWLKALVTKCRELSAIYPTQGPAIDKWFQVCRVQFPLYVEYWKKHRDVVKREPILEEASFSVPYPLPSGRCVYLRGKFDSVDYVSEKANKGIWLQENKTKSDIKEQQVKERLRFDIQTGTYLVALQAAMHEEGERFKGFGKLRGVRYNVIRRPLAGGRHSIKQLQPTKKNPAGESKECYYRRLSGLIQEDADYFFMRWNVDITPDDIEKFKNQFLTPILEDLCSWYLWVSYCYKEGLDPFSADPEFLPLPLHFRYPHNVYNPTLEGNHSEYDEVIETGSELGLVRVENLFREL